MYNGEQEFRPLPSGGLVPAEHGRDKGNGKAASRPIGDTPKGVGLTSDRCSPVVHRLVHVEGLPSGPVQMVRSWSNVKSAREKVSSSRARGKLGQLQIQIGTEILYCCRVAVFFAGGFFSFLSPISSNPTYTT